MSEHYMMPRESFDAAVKLANKAGLNGLTVNIRWIAPSSVTHDPIGTFAIEYHKSIGGQS